MSSYRIGLYEKAMPNDFSWKEKLICAKECGYDFLEISIDASEEKINRIYMTKEEKKAVIDAMFEAELPIRSVSVSALTKYALGDPNDEIRERGMTIAVKSVELAADLGIRIVMIPGYDIYYGESTLESKKYFIENIRKLTEVAAREGVVLGFETMENDFMNTVGKALKYCHMVDSPYLNIYADSGNITNAAVANKHDVCEDISLGNGNLVAFHLKESKPGLFREIPFLTGHVEFERVIEATWKLGVRRYVTELWYVGQEKWKEDICFANSSMRAILDKQ